MSDAGAGPGGARGPLKPVKPKTFHSLPVVAVVVILGTCLVAISGIGKYGIFLVDLNMYFIVGFGKA
jgi:hypothetical protein